MPSGAQQIAAVARRHDIAIIENDVLGPLVEDRPPPVAAFAPERTLYVTSFTKIVRAGPAHRLSRRARPLCRCRRQPASRLQLDGDADGRRDRDALGDRRHGDGTGPLAAVGAAAAARRSPPKCWPGSTTASIATEPASLAAAARRTHRGGLRRPGPPAGRGDRAGRIVPHLGRRPGIRQCASRWARQPKRNCAPASALSPSLLLGDPEHLLLAI